MLLCVLVAYRLDLMAGLHGVLRTATIVALACNEALSMLATAGKFIIKSIQIAHNPINNLLTDAKRILSSEGEPLEITASGARSLYVEVLGNVTMTIYVDGSAVVSESISSKAHYTPVRKLISVVGMQTVKVKFENAKNPSEDFERQFSATSEYDATQQLIAVQEQLVTEMTKDITDQIFNATVANW